MAVVNMDADVELKLSTMSLSKAATMERLPLLKDLQAAGLTLPQRQAVANSLFKAKREGLLIEPSSPALGVSDPEPAAPTGDKLRPPPGIRSVTLKPGEHCRIFVISDAHADHPANLDWIKTRLPPRVPGAFDVCVCAGDVSDTPATLCLALAILKQHFSEVVFTPGNHELWIKPKPIAAPGDATMTSLSRLHEVRTECEKLGVHTVPLWIISARADERDVLAVPLDAWYHECFDSEPELPVATATAEEASGASFRDLWTDHHLCKWPPDLKHGSLALAEHFAALNEPSLTRLTTALTARPAGRPPPERRLTKLETYALYGQQPYQTGPLWTSVDTTTFFRKRTTTRPTHTPAAGPPTSVDIRRPFIVSLSHMVPRQDLIPEKRMLLQPSLHKVSGSAPLEAQVRRLMPDVHAFGHTHLNLDLTCDGVRYVQWPLGTPREQRAQTRVSSFGLMCVYDAANGGETPQHWTHWGRHYEENERDLTKVERPPYVLQIQQSLTGSVKAARSTWGHEQSLQHAAGASSVGTSEIKPGWWKQPVK